MAKLTPEEFQEKHARRLKGALEDIRKGVDKVSTSPTDKAAAKKDKMRMKLNEAIDSGKWERGLKAVTLEEWKTKMKDKGVPRISAGIDGAHDKVVSFAGKLLPHIDTGVATIKAMPDLTLEDSIARMDKFTRHMATFKK